MRERRIRSIPPSTAVSVRLGGISLRIGGLGAGTPRQSRLREANTFDVSPYVSPKPTKEKPRRTLILPEREEITLQVEQIEDYNGQGDLGLFLQYSGIELIRARFLRGRVRELDHVIFSLPVRYKARDALLFLCTFGDIFASQVAAVKRDVNPFFQEEIYLPELTTIYNPRTMSVLQKNGLVIVSYNLG